MILRSAGIVSSSLIRGKNAINFAYVIYLRGRAEGLPPSEIESLVRRWYIMAALTQRYGGQVDTSFDSDIRQISQNGLASHINSVTAAELNDSFWTIQLPQELETTTRNSQVFLVYQAAQVKQGDKGFFSRDISILDLVLNRSDVHHVYPKAFLTRKGVGKSKYNQIANFVLTQSEINIAIGDKPPAEYFANMISQCEGGKSCYGGITNREELEQNLISHCIPLSLINGNVPDYDDFLGQRRCLMAAKMRNYYERL
jgi:hypothetical protein